MLECWAGSCVGMQIVLDLSHSIDTLRKTPKAEPSKKLFIFTFFFWLFIRIELGFHDFDGLQRDASCGWPVRVGSMSTTNPPMGQRYAPFQQSNIPTSHLCRSKRYRMLDCWRIFQQMAFLFCESTIGSSVCPVHALTNVPTKESVGATNHCVSHS